VTLIKSMLSNIPTYYLSCFLSLWVSPIALRRFRETFCGEDWERISSTIWLVGTVYVHPFVTEVWESESCCYTIRPCWVNGYGGMREKKKLYGAKLLISSMVDCGGASVPTLSLVRMEKAYGSTLGKAGLHLLRMCTSRWGMGLILNFGSTSGVVRQL
jgi:hypothetical protein